ncbi:hypothetical protein [uncultured Tateyamaria sp.]|uniref:hypothetical protein n=1 Tax=uncultured Tateyamaria sp. TaxID=455651 RepID=UPI00260C89D8|nr:hypothetical protein [uncultured Tateyamaria sp.]
MVEQSLINLRETLFINLRDIADGSLVQSCGSDSLIKSWDHWTDFECVWMEPPVFTAAEVAACKAFNAALSDFDALDIEDTGFVDGLRSLPQYRSVEAFAKIAYATMSERGPRPILGKTA